MLVLVVGSCLLDLVVVGFFVVGCWFLLLVVGFIVVGCCVLVVVFGCHLIDTLRHCQWYCTCVFSGTSIATGIA